MGAHHAVGRHDFSENCYRTELLPEAQEECTKDILLLFFLYLIYNGTLKICMLFSDCCVVY